MINSFSIDGFYKERRLCYLCPPTGGPTGGPVEGPVNQALQYLRTMPVVGKVVTEMFPEPEKLTNKTMLKLADDGEWIRAFREADIFTAPQNPEAPSGDFGPTEVLLHLSKDERVRQFNIFSLRFIPEDVRIKNGIGKDFAEIQANGQRDIFGQALGVVVGSEVPAEGTKARTLAVESLNKHYKIDPATPGISDTLRDESRRDFEWHQQRGRTLTPYSAEPPPIGGLEPPLSQFRGAMRLGVFDAATVEELRNIEKEYTSERSRVITGAVGELSRLGAIQEGMGMRDVWRNLGGGEKLVLLITAFMLLRSDKGKPLLFAGVAAYFGYKFFNKGGDPLEMLDRQMSKIRGEVNPLEEISNRAQTIKDFSGGDIIGRNEPEVVGAGFLWDIPLRNLCTILNKGPDGRWSINPKDLKWQDTKTPSADRQATVARIQEWLAKDENNRSASSMLAYTFFRLGSSNTSSSRFGSVALNESYLNLTDETIPTRTTFDQMVEQGKERSLNTSLSLGEYFEEEAQKTRESRGVATLEAILPSNDANKTLRNDLNTLEGDGYQFKELLPGDIKGKYVLVEFPAGATATSGLGALNPRPSFVVDAGRFRTALGKVSTGGFESDVVNGQLSLMQDAPIKEDIVKIVSDINPTGSAPRLVNNARYVPASKTVCVDVDGAGFIEVDYKQWLHWRMVDGLSPGRIMSRVILERSVPIAAASGVPPPSGKIDVPGADALLEGKLKMLLSDPDRYSRGIRRAIYDKVVVPGGGEARGEFERATALGGGTNPLGTITELPGGVRMVTIKPVTKGGREGFIPVYNLLLRRTDGTEVRIENYPEGREFVDRKDI